MKDIQADGSWNEEVVLGKMWVAYCKVTFLQGQEGIYQAVYLTRVDQLIPD